jgi:phenylacetate-CoA ligase
MLYRKLLENIILPTGDFFLGTEYIKNLRKFRKIQKMSAEEIAALQRRNLDKLLSYATQNVPFYRQYSDEKVSDPFLWLKRLPVMDKKTIKENIDELIIADRNKLIVEKSSGSSGIQGEVYMTKKESSASMAIQTLWWEWAGYKFGNTLVQTGMTTKRGFVKGIKDILLRTDYVPAFGMSDEFIIGKLNELRKNQRDHLGGYASSLYVLARVAEKYNITDVSFKSVISWGDKMFPHFRSLIERQFQTKVFDTYGCTEGMMMAAQKDLDEYYIMSPHVIIELLDKEGNEVAPGELGYVVVTRLDAYAMPLIRYYLGDIAIKAPYTVPNSQLHFPLIQKIIGRDTDIVRTASGKYMIVHSFTGLFEHISEIRQFRVVQDHLDSITIEVIPGIGFGEQILNNIRATIQKQLQEPFEINFRVVDDIPSTPSGKPQIIKSSVAI